jgi:ribosomal protein S18 acetylase RimI-like enzyme
MKLVRWKRFSWDLGKLPAEHEPALASHFMVRAAGRDEEKSVRNVIFTSFGMDTAWGDSFKNVLGYIESQLNTSFMHRAVPCLVITHGVRIIAASALNTGEDAPAHLLSGPCVLPEYRNRGLGTALLHESLLHLKNAGLARAYGISKEGVTATKFVYPKFGSTNAEFDFDPMMTAQ